MNAAFVALGLTPTPEGVCAVVAVTAQESGFHVDPIIPDLGAIAWREIERRAAHDAIPVSLVHQVLELKSPTGRSYAERIDHARTEKELSDIFEDFTGAIPLGRSLFASWNPIRTRGPMQVNVAFAEQFAAAHPYPYPIKQSIADEVFTRRGSLYFGVAHLLDYQAPYDRYLYRFADFNAGQYASRNAAFQRAVSVASGLPLDADGALLPHGSPGGTGHTELAVRALERAPAPRRDGDPRGARARQDRGIRAHHACTSRCSRWPRRLRADPCRAPWCRKSAWRGRRSAAISPPTGMPGASTSASAAAWAADVAGASARAIVLALEHDVFQRDEIHHGGRGNAAERGELRQQSG